MRASPQARQALALRNALLRSREPCRRAVAWLRNRDAPNAHGLHITDVVQREEAVVGCNNARHAAEDPPVTLDRRHERLRVVLGHDRDIRDDAAFGRLHFDHLPEFRGLSTLPRRRILVPGSNTLTSLVAESVTPLKMRNSRSGVRSARNRASIG